jgi:hypothetical protein
VSNRKRWIWDGPFAENEIAVWDEKGLKLTTREECPHLQDDDPGWIPADTPHFEKWAWLQGLPDELEASGAAVEDAPIT